MLDVLWLYRIIDPDEERLTDSGPAVHPPETDREPVVRELATPRPAEPTIRAGVKVKEVLASSGSNQPPATTVGT